MSQLVPEKIATAPTLEALFNSSSSSLQFGEYVRVLGLEKEGDGGDGNFIKIDPSSDSPHATYAASEDGKSILKLKDGSGVFVREALLRQNIVEPRWYGLVKRSRVLNSLTRPERERNWRSIWQASRFTQSFGAGRGMPVNLQLPNGKIEVTPHKPITIDKAAGGAEGTTIYGAGAHENGTWLLVYGGIASDLIDVVSTNQVEVRDIKISTMAPNMLQSFVRFRAGDWFDRDGKTSLNNGLDKCVGGHIHDLVCQTSHPNFAPSVAAIWLYGVGGAVVERCNIGNQATMERAMKLGADSRHGKAAHRQLPKGMVDATRIDACNLYQGSLYIEKASGCAITRTEFISAAGRDLWSHIKVEGQKEITNLTIRSNQFWSDMVKRGPEIFEVVDSAIVPVFQGVDCEGNRVHR